MLWDMNYGKEKGMREHFLKDVTMKKFLRKKFGPASLTLRKFWFPPLAHWKKNWSPPLTTPKNSGLPPQTDGPPPGNK